MTMPKLIDKDGNELLNLQMSADEHWTTAAKNKLLHQKSQK